MPPFAVDPLHTDPSVEELPASQAQYLMALAQWLQGMAFALDPATVHSFLPTPEVPVQPTIALQAHHIALSPSPSPQLFAALAV